MSRRGRRLTNSRKCWLAHGACEAGGHEWWKVRAAVELMRLHGVAVPADEYRRLRHELSLARKVLAQTRMLAAQMGLDV